MFLKGAVLAACLLLSAVVARAESAGPLVDAAWVARNKASIKLLDVRNDAQSFAAEGHIPGAVLVLWDQVRSQATEEGQRLEDMLPKPEVFERLMRASGVDAGSMIVLSSRGLQAEEMFLATRLYWQLKYYGHDRVAVLDGGTGAWVADGRKLTRGKTPKPKSGTWAGGRPRPELLVTTAAMRSAVQSRSHVLADARTVQNYLGLTRYKARVDRDGHIPGAKHVDARYLLEEGRPVRFRPVGEIKSLLGGLGLDINAPTIAYCDTGDWASGIWFVMHELLGNHRAALYDGSMHAWTKAPERETTRFRLD